MTPPLTDREALIAALAEEARSTGTDGPEPEPEKLLDFLAGRLDPEEEELLSRHLVANPKASRALLDLANLDAARAEAGKRPPDLAALAGWRDFERRLPAPAPSRSRRFLQPWTLQPAALAAALLVSTVGLSTWVWRHQGELSRPVPNLRSLELSESRTSGEPTVPGGELRLVLRPAERCPVYTAELEGPEAGDRQTIPGLVRDEGGVVSLGVRLEPGPHRLRLFGCEPRRELEDYRFQIIRANGE